ncbi:MAG: hypothetical protein ACRDNE_01880 [Gaiellaceae bacterium]
MPTLLLVGCALAISLTRSPTYKAEVRLNAGTLDVETQAIPGFLVASQSLADLYSRTLDAQQVVEPISDRVGLKPETVSSRLSASPIPESSIFVIEASGPSASGAVALANAASDALAAYVATLNRPPGDNRRLLSEFNQASLALAQIISTRNEARTAFDVARTEENQDALQQAVADVQAAKLRLDTLSSLYQESEQADRISAELVQVVSPATSAWSDRNSVLQRLVILALLAGALAGVAFATIRANVSHARMGGSEVVEPGRQRIVAEQIPLWARFLRALLTVIGLAVAGFLVWLSSSFDVDLLNEFWAAVGLAAGAGLVLGLLRLGRGWMRRGGPGVSVAMLGLTALPASAVAGWVLLATQPEGGWQRERLGEWSTSMGLLDVVRGFGEQPLVLAFGVGLVWALAFDASDRRGGRHESGSKGRRHAISDTSSVA